MCEIISYSNIFADDNTCDGGTGAKWTREMRGGLGNDIQCIKEMPLG